MRRIPITTLAAAALVSAAPALAQQESNGSAESPAAASIAARAAVQDRDGTEIGTVTINETPSGTPFIVVALSDLPEGAHGIHIHETGDCSADDFTSAGGHVAGDAQHGILSEGGPHPGDLPNAIVGSSGDVNLEIFASELDIAEMVMDDDGAAFIVHDGPDDYATQPAGDAGDRIACGVFEDG